MPCVVSVHPERLLDLVEPAPLLRRDVACAGVDLGVEVAERLGDRLDPLVRDARRVRTNAFAAATSPPSTASRTPSSPSRAVAPGRRGRPGTARPRSSPPGSSAAPAPPVTMSLPLLAVAAGAVRRVGARLQRQRELAVETGREVLDLAEDVVAVEDLELADGRRRRRWSPRTSIGPAGTRASRGSRRRSAAPSPCGPSRSALRPAPQRRPERRAPPCRPATSTAVVRASTRAVLTFVTGGTSPCRYDVEVAAAVPCRRGARHRGRARRGRRHTKNSIGTAYANQTATSPTVGVGWIPSIPVMSAD